MIQRPITSYHSGWRKAKDRIFFWLVCLFSALTAVPLVVIIWEVVRKGYKQINLNFFTETAPSTLDAMLAKINGEIIPGGIANGITGTLWWYWPPLSQSRPVLWVEFTYRKNPKPYFLM